MSGFLQNNVRDPDFLKLWWWTNTNHITRNAYQNLEVVSYIHFMCLEVHHCTQLNQVCTSAHTLYTLYDNLIKNNIEPQNYL